MRFRSTFLSLLFSALLAQAASLAPKNIILMIGDGMGAKHLQAIQMFANGNDSSVLSTFPVQAWMSTFSIEGSYSPDSVVADNTYVTRKPTDSAASATAFSTGSKTYDAAIGVAKDGNPLYSVCEAAADAGQSTGLVTTVPISHATPAGMVAHQANRNSYSAIAREEILRSRLDVLAGAGHPAYDNNGKAIANHSQWNFDYVGGDSLWTALGKGNVTNLDRTPWTLVQSKASIDSIALGLAKAPQALLAIAPVYETLQQRRTSSLANAANEAVPGTTPKTASVPNLVNLSKAALQVLNTNPNGFFLMIEGGAIDWAAHSNQSARMLEEGTEFLTTIDSVVAWINRNGGFEQNLLIVTADHETGYLSGPSGMTSAIESKGKGIVPGMKWNLGGHTNQLVRIFAKGQGSDLLMARTQGQDPLHGPYTDNALVGQFLHSLLDHPWKVVSRSN